VFAARAISLTIVAALLLTSCAKPKAKRQVFAAGYGYCTNEKLGSFDVTLAVSDEPGLYELTIVTAAAAAYGGQYVRVALANQQLQYDEIVNASLIQSNKTLFQGYVTPEQLDVYPLIVIAPYRGGDFLNSQSEDDEAICQVPSREPTDESTATQYQ